MNFYPPPDHHDFGVDEKGRLVYDPQPIAPILPTQDSLVEIWQSNVDLHERFGVNRTMPKAIRRVDEETREARDEAKAPDIDKTALAHEIVDVFYTWVGVAITAGLTVDDLTDAIKIVNRKNDMKTTDTHYLDQHAGKITRLQKLPIKGGGGT